MAYGWANVDTWNFVNWYGDMLTDEIDENQEMYAEMELDEMADYIESTFYEISGIEEMPIGFARDAAMQAWSGIDWTDIAKSFQPELEEQELEDC